MEIWVFIQMRHFSVKRVGGRQYPPRPAERLQEAEGALIEFWGGGKLKDIQKLGENQLKFHGIPPLSDHILYPGYPQRKPRPAPPAVRAVYALPYSGGIVSRSAGTPWNCDPCLPTSRRWEL